MNALEKACEALNAMDDGLREIERSQENLKDMVLLMVGSLQRIAQGIDDPRNDALRTLRSCSMLACGEMMADEAKRE